MIEITLQEARDIEHSVQNLLDEIDEVLADPSCDVVFYADEQVQEVLTMLRKYANDEEKKYWDAIWGEHEE